MALTVDSFDLLANEIITNLPSLRDILTLIGIYYSAKKILSLALSAVEAAKVHGFSHLSTVKFSEKFGPWAGMVFLCNFSVLSSLSCIHYKLHEY